MNILRMNTILYCRKWPAMVSFYRDTLGLPVNTEHDWFLEFRLTPHARLSIADESKTRQHSSEGRGITLTFQVDSLDEWHMFLFEKGVTPGPINPHPWNARHFFLHDPEGNRLEFWTPDLEP